MHIYCSQHLSDWLDHDSGACLQAEAGFLTDPQQPKLLAVIWQPAAWVPSRPRGTKLHFTPGVQAYSIAWMQKAGLRPPLQRALSILFWSLLSMALTAEPVLRVSRLPETGSALLHNTGLEALNGPNPSGWVPWQSGFRMAPGEGREGSLAAVCQRQAGSEQFGLGQSVTLDRTNPTPILFSAWSKAEGVSGSADSGYALYVDVLYTDGTSLWAQNIGFDCGTHGWQKRELLLRPDRPIRSFTVYGLFRGHDGKVWFDDIAATELHLPPGTVLLQGVPTRPASAHPSPRPAPVRQRLVAEGIELTVSDASLGTLRLEGQEVPRGTVAGFLIRDFAANSDFFAFTNGRCQDLGLELEAGYTAKPTHLEIDARLRDGQ